MTDRISTSMENKIKIPVTQYEIIDLIKNRYSTRAFSDKAIPTEKLKAIIEAAHWAPSAVNEQPWRYIAAQKNNKKAFEKMCNLLAGGNQPWAKNADVLVLSYTKLTYTANGFHNPSALHDLGLANQNLILQARAMDIFSHIMGGFDKEKAKEIFNLTDDYQPLCIIALGYLGDTNALIEPFKERELTPRVRRPLEEVATFL